jgi:hypothetical protein
LNRREYNLHGLVPRAVSNRPQARESHGSKSTFCRSPKEDADPHLSRASSREKRRAVAAVEAGEAAASVARRIGRKPDTVRKWVQRERARRDAGKKLVIGIDGVWRCLSDEEMADFGGYLDDPDYEALRKLHRKLCRCNGTHIKNDDGLCFKCARPIGDGIPLDEDEQDDKRKTKIVPSRVPLRVRHGGRWWLKTDASTYVEERS